MKKFIVYSKSDCHLCDVMIQKLNDIKKHYPLSFEVVDIEGNAELTHEYGFFIPVLVFNGDKVCHYELNEDALMPYLKA